MKIMKKGQIPGDKDYPVVAKIIGNSMLIQDRHGGYYIRRRGVVEDYNDLRQLLNFIRGRKVSTTINLSGQYTINADEDFLRIQEKNVIVKETKVFLVKRNADGSGSAPTKEIRRSLFRSGVIRGDFHVLKLRAILKNSDEFELDDKKMWRVRCQ